MRTIIIHPSLVRKEKVMIRLKMPRGSRCSQRGVASVKEESLVKVTPRSNLAYK